MSWSVQKHVGKPEAIAPAVAEAFDKAASYYAGKTEERDVLGARDAVAAWLAETKLPEGYGVSIEASGSRGDTWLNITVACGMVKLIT